MLRIVGHIESLLLRNDCVIIPRFGGFVLREVPASFEETGAKFCPPHKEISFNTNLRHTDGLLAESYMQVYDVDYGNASEMLERDVEALEKCLREEKCLDCGKIGSFRLGDEGSGLSDGSDTIWGRYHENIILDHCSMSWSIDECASFYGNSNFTMQWCILTESLKNSVHGKGSHGYGGIWGGEDASFHHNMLSCHDSRNPRFDHPEIYETPSDPQRRGNVDFRNNVIYNWGDNSTYGGEDGHFNIVGNYYKPGPASKERIYFVDAYWYHEMDDGSSSEAYPELYMSGN